MARLSGSAKIWTLGGCLSLGSMVLALIFVGHLGPFDASFRLPWWTLAAMMYIAEANVVHIQFRRDSESFSLSELPLVLGLFFADPGSLIVARVVGTASALLMQRRQPPIKLAYNVGLTTLETVLAIIVFRTIAVPGDTLGLREGLSAFAAVALPGFLSVVLVMAAIGLAEGKPSRAMFVRVSTLGALSGTTNMMLGLVGVAIMRINPVVALLLLVPAAVLYFAYRAYTSERAQHEKLDRLYEATRSLNRSIELGPTVASLLSQARTMFRAEIASITLLPTDGDDRATRTWLGQDEQLRVQEIDLDPTMGVWARAISEGQAILISRPIRSERLRRYLEEEGIYECVVAPLFGEHGFVGIIKIANRLGDVGSFGTDDLTLLDTLANHASVALENARLVASLQDSLVRLTELNRMKDDFVATVSHELRTPLTSIDGFVKTLLRPDASYSSEEQRIFLEVVERQSKRLRVLIEDLLLASRIEQQGVAVSSANVSLDALAREVASGYLAEVTNREVWLDLGPMPRVLSDESSLHRILSNLVDNAIKYSPVGTKITLRGRAQQDSVLISVTDEGEGIPAHQKEAIFERFYQVDQSTTRRVGGTGLGLYISRRLAETLGAHLWLDRSEPGRGSTFCLRVPYDFRSSAPAAEPAMRSDAPPMPELARAAMHAVPDH